MKNIVLVDIYGNFISSALATGEFNIKLAMLDNTKISNKCKEIFGTKIETYYNRCPKTNDEFEALHKTDYNLTYEDIEKYRYIQLKVERFLRRELYDESSIQARYYTALRYFIDFFNKNQIDCVVAAHIEHGAIWDSLIFEIAKSKNIPVYIISINSSNDKNEINSVIRFNDRYICPLDDLEHKNEVDTEEFFVGIKRFMKNSKKDKFTIKNILKKIGLYAEIKYILRTIKSTFCGFSSKAEKLDNKYIHQMVFNDGEILTKTIYIKNLLKAYNKYSAKPDYNEKYIFYPLHQEPEASFMVRTTMSSQLFIIQQISRELPKGWKLYVKEHPSEFYAYKQAPYFYKNVEYFRSLNFYKMIKELDNVELIDLSVSTQELIKNSQAVTSITGTALIEGLMKNKPIIIWGNGVHFIEKIKDAFCIQSLNDLKHAVAQIKEGFIPKYDDFSDVLKKYTFYMPLYGTTCIEGEDELYKQILTKICK